MSFRFAVLGLGATALVAAACSDNSTAPTGTTPATALSAVTFGPATTTQPGGTVTMRFNGAMMPGMEQYVDLHHGDITGPVVPMTCTWSTDHVTLTCTPNGPLVAGQQYTLHMGAGMQASNGTPVSMAAGTGMGGTWMTSGMGGMHNGPMMGSGWQDQSGHDGMLFPFTAGTTTPTGTTPATALSAVTFGPATTTQPGGTVTMRFNGAMMTGMEQYVDLHQGDITGPVVPMTCTWSTDHTTLTCTPNGPLAAGQQYTLHMGAGMQASNGTPVNMAAGTGMGGTWMTSGMGGMHNGSMMGSGWQDQSGHDGMLFPFTAS